MSATITRDEWLQALTEAGVHSAEDDQSALTTTEFAEMFGVTVSTAHSRLQLLVAAGKAQATRKWATNAYGRRIQYRAYRLVRDAAPKRTRQ